MWGYLFGVEKKFKPSLDEARIFLTLNKQWMDFMLRFRISPGKSCLNCHEAFLFTLFNSILFILCVTLCLINFDFGGAQFVGHAVSFKGQLS